MTKKESAVLAKIATGPWDKEFTNEIAIAFHMALEPFTYTEAAEAITVLLRQGDRRFAPNPGEIVGQIKLKNAKNNPARQYYTANDAEPPASTLTQEQKLEQVKIARATFPDLFKATEKRSRILVQQKGFDEGCSD